MADKELHLEIGNPDLWRYNGTESASMQRLSENSLLQGKEYVDIVYDGEGGFSQSSGSDLNTPNNLREVHLVEASDESGMVNIGGIYNVNVSQWLSSGQNQTDYTSSDGYEMVYKPNEQVKLNQLNHTNTTVTGVNVSLGAIPEYQRAVFDIYTPSTLEPIESSEHTDVYGTDVFKQEDVKPIQTTKKSTSSYNKKDIVTRTKQAIKARKEELRKEKLKEQKLVPDTYTPKEVKSKVLEPEDHFRELTKTNADGSVTTVPNIPLVADKNELGLSGGQRFADVNDHFHYDRNDYKITIDGKVVDEHSPYGYQSNGFRRMQGSTTPLYTDEEIEKKEIFGLADGLYKHEQKFDGGARKLSPLQPFIRPDKPWFPQYANYYAYNRTKTASSDLEWRKGFRHIFITRPECYIMARGNELSDQCLHDDVFYSSFLRMPHILALLSPSYITCTAKDSPRYKDNFNYLFSNRVMGMSTLGTEIDQVQSMVKSTVGASVLPGGMVSNDYGNSLSLNFRDTKTLEVYEAARLWMRYISNVYRGRFASSYNNYQVTNTYNFTGLDDDGGIISDSGSGKIPIGTMRHLHPYDRALDYCCTIFDIVVDETGSKILYWCKYIGCYPMGATTSGLNTSQMNEAITGDQQCNIRFYYQGKEEYKNRSLVEFNYNAGIVDEMGKPTMERIAQSLPFLLREHYLPPVKGKNPYTNMNYIGAAGMWTGRPYVVIGTTTNHITGTKSYIPFLRFMNLEDMIANEMNADITNNNNQSTDPVMAIYQ
jgi:hypothetical protein